MDIESLLRGTKKAKEALSNAKLIGSVVAIHSASRRYQELRSQLMEKIKCGVECGVDVDDLCYDEEEVEKVDKVGGEAIEGG